MTLEEKAAQMMCVWQQKAETLVDAEGNFDLKEGRRSLQARARPGPGRAAPAMPAAALNARATAELTNAIQKFFLETAASASR